MFGTMLGIAEDACGRAFDALTSHSYHTSDDRVLDALHSIDDNLRRVDDNLTQMSYGYGSRSAPKGPSMAERAQEKWREHARQGRR